MKYGAKGIMIAPFAAENPEPEGAVPNYETPFNLGELNRVSDSPSYSEAKAYGDNALKRYVNEFKEVPIEVDVLDVTNEIAGKVLGAKLDEGATGDLRFTSEDNPPYCGMSFYVNELLAAGVKKFKGICYPKVKATMQGEEYTTKGDSITLAAKKLRFMGSACNDNTWKIESKYFDTEAEAINWTKNILGGGV